MTRSGGKPWFDKKDVAVIAAVFLSALAVRLVYLFQIREAPFFSNPVIDAATYLEEARTFAQGQWLFQESFWQPPLYAFFLSLLLRVFGENHFLLHLIHLILGAANCSLISLLAMKVSSRRSAAVAGGMAALYGPLIFFDGEYLATTLIVCLSLLLFLSLIRFGEKPSARLSLISGLLAGLAAAAWPNLLLFAPAAAVWVRVQSRSWKLVAAFIAAAILPLIPTAAHNAYVSREFAPISTNGGANFYLGNNPDWRSTTAIRPTFEWADLMAEPYRHGALTPNQRSSYFLRLALADISHRPFSFIGRLCLRAGQLIDGRERPRNVDLYFMRDYSPLLKILLWQNLISFPGGLLIPLALIGMFLFRGSTDASIRANFLLLAFFTALYGFSVILFFVTSRYRLPAVPVLIIFAAHALTRGAALIRSRHLGSLGTGAAAFAALAILSNLGSGMSPRPGPADEKLLLGNSFAQSGNLNAAAAAYKEVMALEPGLPDSYLSLAKVFLINGRETEAEELIHHALTLVPEQSMAAAWGHEYWGDILRGRGENGRAAQEYRAALASFPYMSGAGASLCSVLLKEGKTQEARAILAALFPAYPNSPDLNMLQAGFHYESKDYTSAIEILKKALRFRGNDGAILEFLADAYRQAGDEKKAAEFSGKAHRLRHRNFKPGGQ